MSENRENKAVLIIGKRRNGKSTFIVNQLIPIYLNEKKLPVYVIQGKRNPVYDSLIKEKNFHQFLLADISESQPIVGNLHNAAVIFDDAQLLIGKQLSDEVRKMVINLGQSNVEVFFVFHSFTASTRELWTLVDDIIIFNVQESAKARNEFLTEQQITEIDSKVKKLKQYECFDIER